MTITVEAVTHIGKVREENQDAITWQHCPDGPFAYFVVADGMGGYSGGAYASKLAIESAQQALSHVRYSDIQNDTPPLRAPSSILKQVSCIERFNDSS